MVTIGASSNIRSSLRKVLDEVMDSTLQSTFNRDGKRKSKGDEVQKKAFSKTKLYGCMRGKRKFRRIRRMSWNFSFSSVP